jgi:hypothetical protein
VAQRVNELVERYRGLGGPREAAAEAERVVRAMHGRYSLSAAVEGGAQTLEERLPDIARRFADEMVAAHQAPGLGGGGAGGGGRADGRARGDVFQKDGAWYMRRCAAALDLWLEDEFGRSEGAKVRYKARQILELLGGAVTLSLRAQEHRPGLPRVVKCIKLAEVTAENTETALL